MTYTVALANHKGGVGKTTSAIRLATELAAQGRRVLLIDADAQAHTTLYFLGEDQIGERSDLSHILEGQSFADLAVDTAYVGLRLVPASLRLAEAELRLTVQPVAREHQIKRALDPVREEYDFAVIDCPPALGNLTVNALAAADGLVTPVELTNFALNGLAQFFGWLNLFRSEGMVTADLLGVLPTKYDGRQQIDRDGLRALHNWGLPLFEPVPRRTAIERLVAQRGLGINGGEPPEIAQSYRAVAAAVLEVAEQRAITEGRRAAG